MAKEKEKVTDDEVVEGLEKYTFPESGKVVEARSMEEAIEKHKKLINA